MCIPNEKLLYKFNDAITKTILKFKGKMVFLM